MRAFFGLHVALTELCSHAQPAVSHQLPGWFLVAFEIIGPNKTSGMG
jgi:hypothetical protein